MKKLILILIVGILLIGVGIVTAISFGLTEESFDKIVTTISTSKICEAELLKSIKLCNARTPSEIDTSESGLSITKNREGVIRIRNE